MLYLGDRASARLPAVFAQLWLRRRAAPAGPASISAPDAPAGTAPQPESPAPDQPVVPRPHRTEHSQHDAALEQGEYPLLLKHILLLKSHFSDTPATGVNKYSSTAVVPGARPDYSTLGCADV